MENAYRHRLELEVRDYECDLQGVVNNANYQHYLEHARHLFLKTLGIDFAGMAAQGVNLVVARIEIDYKTPLKSGDRFVVGSNLERVSPVRFGFRQDIYRLPDLRPVVQARVIGTAVNARGRPCLPPELDVAFGQLPPPAADSAW
ncbi:MAG: thioesterase family protein [Lentisphaeria bacterium]|jgi:acyl-CoA thioester hydrolase